MSSQAIHVSRVRALPPVALVLATVLLGLVHGAAAQTAALTVLHALQRSTTPAFPRGLTPLPDGSVLLASGRDLVGLVNQPMISGDYADLSPDFVLDRDGTLYVVVGGASFAMSPDGALTQQPPPNGLRLQGLHTLGPDGHLYGSGLDASFQPVLVRGSLSGSATILDTSPPFQWDPPVVLVNGGDGFLYGGTAPGWRSAPDDAGVLLRLQPPNAPGRPSPPTNPRVDRR